MTPETDPPADETEGDEVAKIGGGFALGPGKLIGSGPVLAKPGGVLSPPILVQPPVVSVLVKPNKPFVDRVIPGAIIGVLRPTKAVIVAQEPPPGEQVPAGTPVTVTSAFKETLPLNGLGVHAAVVSKFSTIGHLQDAVAASGTLTEALAKDVAFAELKEGERSAIQTLLGGNVPASDLPAAYEDVRFAINL